MPVQQSSLSPAQGHGPVPQQACTYANAGVYTATLTVHGIDSNGQPVTLADTVKVTIG